MKKMLVPKLRFPEFRDTGEWGLKSLNQITTAIFDGTHQTPTYTENGVPFFSVENIVSGKLNKFISKDDYLVATNKNKPEKGDVLVTRIGNIGFSIVVDWDYEFSIYVTLAVVKKDDRFNSHYLHSFMQSGLYQTEIRSKSLLNAVPCKINMDEFRKTKVLLPTLKEQQKIANCLSSIDELIRAQTQRFDTLKTHKKGLMQQLFPRTSETIPRLRFPEFREAGEWESTTFGKAATFINGKAYKQEELLESGKYRVLRVGNFFTNKEWYFSDLELESDKYCDKGDLLYAWSASFGPRVWAGEKVIYHYHIWKIIEAAGIDKQFLFILLDYETERMKAESANGLGLLHITKGAIEGWECSIPKKEEQQKIADCLSSIDELISAQGQKLDTLKIHKKGLMQQLFPVADAASSEVVA
ncbi:MAG: restriction endonuclease subunit S [Pseudomonas sp.]|uniref:restriction endonuclease subunit S n=1 Tax=Pseudomonas sp. TaxID=306 RepID=UPI003BB4ECF2